MKLYYTPGACSLAAHIVLCEAGYAFDLEKVNLKTKKTEAGIDFNTVSEKSAVPLLLLDNGETVSEASVVVQYLADQKPESGLAPKLGTFERVRLNEWLNFIATEIHKGFFPFIVGLGTEAKEVYRKKLSRHFAYIASPMGIDTSAWPILGEYMRRIEARPKVREARMAEGLPEATVT